MENLIADRLAGILWEARRTGTALDPAADPWSGLTRTRATLIADALYRRGGTSRTWKLGALDTATQRRLGITGPACVPLLAGATSTEIISTVLSRGELVAPKFEAEIGVVVDAVGVPYPVPCVEIADCRFSGWKLPPYGMTADLALQGRMLFGPVGVMARRAGVTVSHDGRRVATGSARWDEAVARLDLLGDLRDADHVATGSITELLDCRPGRWEFDFGTLGHIAVTVV
jgi:2-keto-4-pentenoate hydratase